MAYKILDECLACAACYVDCPFDAISHSHEKGIYVIEPKKCVECDICVDLCPISIIEHDETTPARRRFSAISIIPEKCIGCSLCAKFCPVKAISGVIKKPYTLDASKCIKCGVCLAKCKKDAFDVTYIDEA